MYVKFPFLNNKCCDLIRKELAFILSKSFPHIDFRYSFINNFTIQGLLKHKERLPDDLSSGIVYLYECGTCGATYIGQTKKCLRTRAAEHFGVSSRTGGLLARPPQSTIRDHLEACNSGRSLENFKCLGSFSNNLFLRISESIEIHFRKPNLNVDNSSIPLLTL